MKAFAVYGTDTTKALAEFDTANETIDFARKHLRDNGWGRTVKSRKYKEVYYQVRKVDGKVKVTRHIAVHA